MPISATMTAPPRQLSPVRRAAPLHRPSPLNPTRTLATAQTFTKPSPSSTTTITSTHLANLERILQRPSPAPTPPPPPLPEGDEPRWGFLNALNLSGILPEAREMEDMSPRSLNTLQRVLTDTSRPSPLSGIGQRWRDLHGANDWSGLLDPLDEDLRREIVRYGEFVQAAYHAFHSNPEKRPSGPRHVALPDRSYRVTRDLYATSSIEAPRWVCGVAPWMRQRSSWVGFVAVCDGEREIQRMGRRDVVVALRGTATALEWAENFRAALVDIPPHGSGSGSDDVSSQAAEPKVERGFWSLFKTGSKHVASLCDAVAEEVRRLREVYRGEQLSITVTGHSLGAALAVLVADELRARDPAGGNTPPVAVFSFGGPHVGNRAFADRVRALGVKVLRVVNERDVITRVPGVFSRHHKEEDERVRQRGNRMSMPGKWRVAVERAMSAWGYAHLGSELRVDSRQSPYLKPDADAGCCHDLEAYLHLVDGFLSSRCPFRANAKRSIARLVTQQGSNLKSHYTSKALAALGMEVAASLDAAASVTADCRRAATAAACSAHRRQDHPGEILETY